MYSIQEAGTKLKYLKNIDYLLSFITLTLSGIGILTLHSATRVMPEKVNGDSIFLKQVIALILGILLCIILNTVIDYDILKKLSKMLYLASIALLVLVLFLGTGKSQVGTNGWFYFMGVGFQPAEFSKLSFVLVLSIFLEKIKDNENTKRNIIKLIIYSIIPIILVLVQPDTGTALVFIFTFFIMVFICGIPYKYIFLSIFSFVASLPFIWYLILKPYQKDRILAFISPNNMKYLNNISYQSYQGQMAIGSGQIFGNGLYDGLQTQSLSIPEKHTDFIFSVIGEELGFIGCLIVVVLFYILLIRCVYIARNTRDRYGSFVIIGLTSMFAFHITENIGMNVGILPITGIPLPFMSYGGSSLLASFAAVGIILNISSRNFKKGMFS